ncbi:mediator of RNA polymerase II transcription subunit 10 [Coniella lustricola]|uniref:Mediator of RNA polymerase II transcription subunit 10 n=1 Tax=Coniella lustricola TaxID=2025994 RepID=A0A2T2ZYQ0_9PEZI|nr:mediator of RNA polymerase II transcription subunit 10 [Coniella lustricola]
MAPIEPDHNAVERQLKMILQILYETMIQIATYDAHTAPSPPSSTTNGNLPPSTATSSSSSPPTREVLAAQLSQLSTALRSIHTLAADAGLANTLSEIPRELVTYVDGGRNPDIYTREFVELVRRENQLMKGKMDAFASFRDVLAREIASANPELKEDVARVVVGTGGEWPVKVEGS